MRIAIIGFGNLGKGICRAFVDKADFLKQAHGLIPKVVAVVDEFGAALDDGGLNLPQLLRTAEASGTVAKYPGAKRGKLALDVISDVSADIVFELTPTNIRTGEPGISHIKAAMQAGKHVITSNKGPLVVAFRELDSLARRQGVEFKYSASVGGAIPVISLARKLLGGNEISEIRGVLNGTTNYILSRMTAEGVPQDIIIREAQELGYAEKDPSLDIDGIDTACKVTILANSVLGIDARLSDVKRVGIRRITPDATRLAQESGQAIKLVGIARRGLLEVGPKLVPLGHPLAVGGTLNAVTFELDLAREISIAGFGAGSKETASSLLGDLLDVHHTLGG